MDISYRKDGYYMKKFTLYSFSADDEGGYGICKSEKFTPELHSCNEWKEYSSITRKNT